MQRKILTPLLLAVAFAVALTVSVTIVFYLTQETRPGVLVQEPRFGNLSGIPKERKLSEIPSDGTTDPEIGSLFPVARLFGPDTNTDQTPIINPDNGNIILFVQQTDTGARQILHTVAWVDQRAGLPLDTTLTLIVDDNPNVSQAPAEWAEAVLTWPGRIFLDTENSDLFNFYVGTTERDFAFYFVDGRGTIKARTLDSLSAEDLELFHEEIQVG
jgi:hypothetical protein